LLVPKGNPRKIRSIADLGHPAKIVNRQPGTGTACSWISS
jgi:molybdate-binding protein